MTDPTDEPERVGLFDGMDKLVCRACGTRFEATAQDKAAFFRGFAVDCPKCDPPRAAEADR